MTKKFKWKKFYLKIKAFNFISLNDNGCDFIEFGRR